ncbi:MAG: hypothetical protein K8T91_25765 [Planctomycetes bacterium]|nr:hypothetical protein [Planctomycetota bacterium]
MTIADTFFDAKEEIQSYLDNGDCPSITAAARIHKAVVLMDCVQLGLDRSPSLMRDAELASYYAELDKQLDNLDLGPLLQAKAGILAAAASIREMTTA